MKLIGRTLLILAAALAVAGLTYLYASSRAAQSQGLGRERGGELGQRPPEFGGAPRPGQFGRERERGPGGFRLFAVGEIIKNLVLIGVVIAAVRGLAHLIGPRRSRPRRPPPGQPAANT